MGERLIDPAIEQSFATTMGDVSLVEFAENRDSAIYRFGRLSGVEIGSSIEVSPCVDVIVSTRPLDTDGNISTIIRATAIASNLLQTDIKVPYTVAELRTNNFAYPPEPEEAEKYYTLVRTVATTAIDMSRLIN